MWNIQRFSVINLKLESLVSTKLNIQVESKKQVKEEKVEHVVAYELITKENKKD